MEADVAAAELYRLAPGEFTLARDAMAATARKAGDRELAATIKALRRPTASAWMANWLTRERTDELARLLAMGAAMRSAQEHLDGGQLRGLSRQTHRVVAALVGEARRGASEAALSVSDGALIELEQTLKAALADEDVAGSLWSGRLATALSHTGFGPVRNVHTGDGPPGRGVDPPAQHGASPPAEPTGADGDIRALDELRHSQRSAERARKERIVAAEGDLRAAEAVAGAANNALAEAMRRVISAQARSDTLAIEISDLETQVDGLRQQAQKAGEVLGAAEVARTQAQVAATNADGLRSAAEQRLSDLTLRTP